MPRFSEDVAATSRFSSSIGLEVLDRVAANDLTGARLLLDWLRDDWHLAVNDDPLSGEPFLRFWMKGRNADAAAIKIAAALLLIRNKGTAARALAVLEEGEKSAGTDAEKSSIAVALIGVYDVLENYEKALALSADLARQYPESSRAFLDQSFYLRVLGRFEEADHVAEDRLHRMPADTDALRALVWSATDREDYAKAHTLGQRMIDAGKATFWDLNNIAWRSLFTGKVEDSDIQDALKAAQLSQNNASILHTLACIYAEVGKTRDAREVLVQAMDSSNLDEPNESFWYAFGRIAEQSGERDTALSDYALVTRPERAIDIPSSSYRLAQIRLQGLRNNKQ